MNVSELKSSLGKGDLSSVYAFWGEDLFSQDQAFQFLRAALTQKHPGYEEMLWNSEKSLNQLLEELGSFSFFSKHKFVRIEGDDFCNEEDLTKLSQALENNSLATLAFVPKKKTAFNQVTKYLKNIAETVECVKPKAKDLGTFVHNFAKEESKQISSLAARKLIEFIGEDLLGLQNQVRLLSIYVGQRDKIEVEDVEKLFAESAEKDVFALTEYVLQNEKSKTFSLLRKLLDQGEVPLILFSLLARHYRTLLKIKLLERRKQGPYEMASALKLPAFVIEKNLPQARKITWKKLIEVYQSLANVDMQLKSSPLTHLAILEKFLWTAF